MEATENGMDGLELGHGVSTLMSFHRTAFDKLVILYRHGRLTRETTYIGSFSWPVAATGLLVPELAAWFLKWTAASAT